MRRDGQARPIVSTARGNRDRRKASRPPAAAERPLVTRLMGLETEYATLVVGHGELAAEELPGPRAIYSEVCRAIRRSQPTVPGFLDHEQLFLANGGALTFESHPASEGGLIELATPEVRSPSELLACQRGLDQLVAEAASKNRLGVDVRVLKNSSDAYGHLYGCQENYEATVARGAWLVLYRTLVLLLWAVQAVGWLLALPLLLMAVSATLLRGRTAGRNREAAGEASENFAELPGWFTSSLVRLIRLIHLPSVVLLRQIGRHVAFRDQRRQLTAMLVSRVALCGAGELDAGGHYRMSAKAMATDRIADLGGYRGERPIFVYGHWLSQLCATSALSFSAPRQMLARRQRLQIGLSDSNLCDLAEFVKTGSVSLVLDMIEAGHGEGLPALSRPLDSLQRIARDWNLVSRVATNCGELSAIEIQKRYLKAAEAFVAATPANRRGEAPLVIERWHQLLDAAAAFRQDAADVDPAVGRIDWLSKRWMIDSLGRHANWATRKKVDLRYHELSGDGYHRQLIALRSGCAWVDSQRVELRRRSPPASSPAARRGWLIREFSGAGERLHVEWTYAVIGSGKTRRRVDFGEHEF